jgi:hypothetical protein
MPRGLPCQSRCQSETLTLHRRSCFSRKWIAGAITSKPLLCMESSYRSRGDRYSGQVTRPIPVATMDLLRRAVAEHPVASWAIVAVESAALLIVVSILLGTVVVPFGALVYLVVTVLFWRRRQA